MNFKKVISIIDEMNQPSKTLTESVVMEKATSKAQQKAAGAALSAKKNSSTAKLKGASKEMAKMSKKELEKIAGTKHKGLPKKKETKESFDTDKFNDEFSKMVEAEKNDKSKDDDSSSTKNNTKKGLTSKQKKLPPGLQKAIAKKENVKESEKRKTAAFIPSFTMDEVTALSKIKDLDELKKQAIELISRPSKVPMDSAKLNANIRNFENARSSSDIIIHLSNMLLSREKLGVLGSKWNKRFETNSASSSRKEKRVFESAEPTLSFRDMMKLVVESGGQQQIDPTDENLFAWASRVAENKLGKGLKSEVYAGLLYERMGGRFSLYDVLSENRVQHKK